MMKEVAFVLVGLVAIVLTQNPYVPAYNVNDLPQNTNVYDPFYDNMTDWQRRESAALYSFWVVQFNATLAVSVWRATNLPAWNFTVTPHPCVNISGVTTPWWGIQCTNGSVTGMTGTSGSIRYQLPDVFDGLQNLTSWNVGNNGIQKHLPPSFCKLPKLRFFNMSSNFITNVPPCFGTIPTLQTLDLSINQLTQLPFTNFSSLPRLKGIDFSQNTISGTFPTVDDLPFIINISLNSNYFSGPISSSLGSLSTLQKFQVSGNHFSGDIDWGLEKLSALTDLDLSINDLTGTIPDIENLTQLVNVDVSFNSLSGDLTKLWAVPTLRSVILRGNSFTGSVPALTAVNLTTFRADGNQFSGRLPSFSLVPNLQTLILDGNSFNGTLPPLPSSLIEFSITNNQMTGSIDNVMTCKGLSLLDLSNNSFTGVVSSNLFTALPIATTMILANNNFTGPLPDFPTSSLATIVDFSYNSFNQTIPSIGTIQLQTLKLNNNKLTGAIAAGLAEKASHLKILDLSSNRLQGVIPKNLGDLLSLTTLGLNDNSLVGFIPQSFSRLSNLQYLSIANNRKLDWPTLSSVESMQQLITLNISANQITASLPVNIGNLTRLTSFDVSNNRMRGTVPEGLLGLPVLKTLRLNGNNFTGTFGRLNADTVELDISSNRFSGDVDFVGQFTAIRTFNVSHNRFNGTIPSISGQRHLISADVSSNELTGQFPSTAGLSNLVYLNASNNDFTGGVPPLSNSLVAIDFSLNNLTSADQFSVIPSLDTCALQNNSFVCPIPWASVTQCSAICVTLDHSPKNMRLVLQSTPKAFSSQNLLRVISVQTNTTLSRLNVTRVQYVNVTASKRATSEQVWVDLNIAAPNGFNQASSARIQEDIATLASSRPQLLGSNGTVTTFAYIPADPVTSSVQSTDSDVVDSTVSKGTISGLAVGGGVLVIIAIVAIILLVRYKKSAKSSLKQFVMIDVSDIPLGAAKKSVIDFDELKEMQKIGEGAFGIVFKARWRETKVAVKQIRAEHVTEEQLKSFLGEVTILQNLRAHPNVVLFIGLTFPPQPLSLVTEFCEGGDLGGYLQRNAQTITEALRMKFILGVAKGMYHLHLEKVVHRDLAVRNILLTKHLEPQVADFGLSREQDSTDSASVTTSVVGPLKWMSPEAISKREYSTKSDVFSFGVVIWEILTGQEPWQGLSPVEAAFGVVARGHRLKIPLDCPPKLQRLMHECWGEDPYERPDFGQIVNFLEGDIEPTIVKTMEEGEATEGEAAPQYEESIDQPSDVYSAMESKQMHEAKKKIAVKTASRDHV